MLNLFLSLLFLTYGLNGQNTVNVSGIVIDAQTKEKLEFVHIGMPEQGIGTVSNQEGAFSFHFPAVFQNDFIIISHIGYQQKWLKKTDFKDGNTTIELIPDPNVLEQVEVTALEHPLEYYIEKAIKKLKKNYPIKLHLMSGFYRELRINADDEKFTRLMEAAIDIQDRGIQYPTSEIKYQVKELRKSYDYTCYTDRQLELEERFGPHNDLFFLFRDNGVRMHLSSNEAARKVMGLQGYLYEPVSLKLDQITHLNGEKIYVISFSSKVLHCKIYLSAEDYGIHRFEHELGLFRVLAEKEKYRAEANRHILKGEPTYGYTVQYQKIDGIYYPSAIKIVDWEGMVNSNTTDEEGATSASYAIHTLIINDLYLKRRDFKRIRYRHQAKKDEDLFDLPFPYNPDFWKNYNVLLLQPIEQKTQIDLEEIMPLEQQFIENGEN